MKRLNVATQLPAAVCRPDYNPSKHTAGIVHLGLGAFHRAHQAVYTDAALSAQGGKAQGENWRIVAVSLRSEHIAKALREQCGYIYIQCLFVSQKRHRYS